MDTEHSDPQVSDSRMCSVSLYVTGHRKGPLVIPRVYDREESIERRRTVHQMYAESNVTSCMARNFHTDQSKCGCTFLLDTSPTLGLVSVQIPSL